jgi:glycosyltransferase involved in cell wall biosynthesis
MEASKYSARYSIKKFAPDILHETYFSYDGFQPHSSKRVLTVYDFIHERYPEMFGPNNHMTTGPKKAAALRADHVICISHSTRRDLIEYCGVQEDKISVVYLGVDDVFKQENSSLGTAAKHPRPYLLFVGKRDGYKNFEKVVRAFSLSSRLKNDFDIVSFGGGALTQDELKIALDCRLRADQLVHYGGGDPVLAQLYSQAAAFIYPSLYEGFGIPPLEAMAAGCPVISSNTSSMPEVVGQAGEYFNPEDEDSMLSAIENVLYSNTHSADLIACGFEQGRKFSWQKCAAETLNIYRSIV